MFNIQELNHSQLDFFTELENIGASHAVTALSAILDEKISLKVPRVQLCEFNHICDLLGGAENLMAGLLVEMKGDVSGFILLVLNAEEAHELAEMLARAMGVEQQEDEGDFSEMDISALKEIANILSGSYLSAISTLTDLNMQCSVPGLAIDMAGAIMNLLAASCGTFGDIVLFLETEFHCREKVLSGHFFLVPDAASYHLLLEKMGIS